MKKSIYIALTFLLAACQSSPADGSRVRIIRGALTPPQAIMFCEENKDEFSCK
jgi:hypothetical protein